MGKSQIESMDHSSPSILLTCYMLLVVDGRRSSVNFIQAILEDVGCTSCDDVG